MSNLGASKPGCLSISSRTISCALLIFILSFSVRTYGAFLFRQGIFDEWFYVTVGRALVDKLLALQLDFSPMNRYLPAEQPMFGVLLIGLVSRGLQDILALDPYVAGRMLSVTASSSTCVVVYLLGKRLLDARVGLLAALLLSFNGESLWMGMNVLLDPLSILLITLAVFAAIDKKFNVAGLFSGLAMATKYLPVLVLLLSFIILTAKPRPSNSMIARAMLIGSIAFFLSQPLLWGNPLAYWSTNLAQNARHLSAGHAVWFLGTRTSFPPFSYYVLWLVSRLSIPETILLFAAVAFLVSHGTRNARIAWGLFAIPLVFLSSLTVKQPTYMYQVYPFMSLILATGACECTRTIRAVLWKKQSLAVIKHYILLLIPTAVLLLQLVSVAPYFPYTGLQYNPIIGSVGVEYLVGIGSTEGLDAASAWLQTNAPNSNVMVFGYGWGLVSGMAPAIKTYAGNSTTDCHDLDVRRIDYLLYHDPMARGRIVEYYLRHIQPIYTFKVHDVTTVYIWKRVPAVTDCVVQSSSEQYWEKIIAETRVYDSRWELPLPSLLLDVHRANPSCVNVRYASSLISSKARGSLPLNTQK